LVNNPVEISVTPRNATAVSVEQWLHPVDKKRKTELLIKLIADGRWDQALVFSRTKHGANKITKTLETQVFVPARSTAIKAKAARTRALADFKEGRIRILVATDIAARWIRHRTTGLMWSTLTYQMWLKITSTVSAVPVVAGATGKAISLVACRRARPVTCD